MPSSFIVGLAACTCGPVVAWDQPMAKAELEKLGLIAQHAYSLIAVKQVSAQLCLI